MQNYAIALQNYVTLMQNYVIPLQNYVIPLQNYRTQARSSEGGTLGGGLKQAEFRLKEPVWSISQTASFSLFGRPNKLNSAWIQPVWRRWEKAMKSKKITPIRASQNSLNEAKSA